MSKGNLVEPVNPASDVHGASRQKVVCAKLRSTYNRNCPTRSTPKTDIPSATSNESFVKRLAKILLWSAPRKRSKVCERLFQSGIEDLDSMLMSVSPLQVENPQDNRGSGTNLAFDSSVEVSYVFNHRKEYNQNNVERGISTLFCFF